ncbi:hypothetical protein LEMLEM_LOCUS10732, partial [Lemmus lemmus]
VTQPGKAARCACFGALGECGAARSEARRAGSGRAPAGGFSDSQVFDLGENETQQCQAKCCQRQQH